MAVTANGALDAVLLAPIAGHPNARLRVGAAGSWAVLRSEVQRRFGWTPAITSDADAFRSLAIQTSIFRARYQTTATSYGQNSSGVALYDRRVWDGVAYWRRRGQAAAAVPGTSNHGWGRAVDITSLGGFGGGRYEQLAAVANGLGWTNTEGRSVDEAWHWVFQGDLDTVNHPIGSTGTIPTAPTIPTIDPIEEDDMSAAGEAAILAALSNIEGILTSAGGNGLRGDVQASARVVDRIDGNVGTVANELRAGLVALGQQIATDDDGPTAEQIAAAIPASLAADVADELANRLTKRPTA